MARNMITGIETQKMQEYTQEQIDRAEHMGIAIPADVKEQIFEYANLVGEEEKVRTLVRNLADAVNRSGLTRSYHRQAGTSGLWIYSRGYGAA